MRLCRIFFKSEVFKDPTEGTSAEKRSRKAAFFNEITPLRGFISLHFAAPPQNFTLVARRTLHISRKRDTSLPEKERIPTDSSLCRKIQLLCFLLRADQQKAGGLKLSCLQVFQCIRNCIVKPVVHFFIIRHKITPLVPILRDIPIKINMGILHKVSWFW